MYTLNTYNYFSILFFTYRSFFIWTITYMPTISISLYELNSGKKKIFFDWFTNYFCLKYPGDKNPENKKT